jgi:hypothetical protein
LELLVLDGPVYLYSTRFQKMKAMAILVFEIISLEVDGGEGDENALFFMTVLPNVWP